MQHPPTVWDGVLRRLQTELPEFALEAWIRPLAVCEEPGRLRLLARSEFHRERVRSRFLELLKTSAECEADGPVEVALELADAEAAGPTPAAAGAAGGPPGEEAPVEPGPQASGRRTAVRPAPPVEAPHRRALRVPPPGDRATASPAQAALPMGHTFATFVVGPGNALAREASLAVAQGRQPGVSPLFLLGPSGTGKSHLARAVVTEAHHGGAARPLYTSAETFTSELLASIRGGTTNVFKRRYRQGCDLLVVEDVQFLQGKSSTQLELFHTLEHLARRGARIVLTADRLPREIPRLDGRLGSWMGAGLVAELEAPDRELRRAILREKAARGGVGLPEECLDLLADAALGSVRDLEGVLIQLVATASLLKRPVDRALTELALRKVMPPPRDEPGGPVELRGVIEAVSSFFGTTPEALASRSRKKSVLVPRQLAMYLCRRYTDASLVEIGRALGRDHPAVRHAVTSVERAILERAPLRYQVEALVERIEARRRR
jgi:chromosomal replication initiator protein